MRLGYATWVRNGYLLLLVGALNGYGLLRVYKIIGNREEDFQRIATMRDSGSVA
jgi:hypothetical protein